MHISRKIPARSTGPTHPQLNNLRLTTYKVSNTNRNNEHKSVAVWAQFAGWPLFCSLQFTEWAAMETSGCNAHGATGGASAQDMLQRIANFTLLMLIARQTRPPSYSAVGASTIRCSRSVKPKIKNRWARHFARPNALGLLQCLPH